VLNLCKIITTKPVTMWVIESLSGRSWVYSWMRRSSLESRYLSSPTNRTCLVPRQPARSLRVSIFTQSGIANGRSRHPRPCRGKGSRLVVDIACGDVTRTFYFVASCVIIATSSYLYHDCHLSNVVSPLR